MKPMIAVLLLCACLGGCANRFGYVLKDDYSIQSANDAELAFAYADARNSKGDDSDDCKKLQAEMLKRPLPHGWEWDAIRAKRVEVGMSSVAVTAIYGMNTRGTSSMNYGETTVRSERYTSPYGGGKIITYEDGIVVGVTSY